MSGDRFGQSSLVIVMMDDGLWMMDDGGWLMMKTMIKNNMTLMTDDRL